MVSLVDRVAWARHAQIDAKVRKRQAARASERALLLADLVQWLGRPPRRANPTSRPPATTPPPRPVETPRVQHPSPAARPITTLREAARAATRAGRPRLRLSPRRFRLHRRRARSAR